MSKVTILATGTKIMVGGYKAIIQDNDMENSLEDLSNLNYYIKYEDSKTSIEDEWYDVMIHHTDIESIECSCCHAFVPCHEAKVVTTNDFPNGRVVCSHCHPTFEGECRCCQAPISFDDSGDGDSYTTCCACLENFCDCCVFWNENGESPTCLECLKEGNGWYMGRAYAVLRSHQPMPEGFDTNSVFDGTIGGFTVVDKNGLELPFDWVVNEITLKLDESNHLIMECEMNEFDNDCYGVIHLGENFEPHSIFDFISPSVFEKSKLKEIGYGLFVTEDDDQSEYMFVKSFGIDFYHEEMNYYYDFNFSQQQIDEYNQNFCIECNLA